MLATSLGPIGLRTPILTAAGTAGTLDELADCIDLARLGGIVTKSITREPRDGNQTWRILPERAGMLNAIGLANPGIERFLADHAPRIARMDTTVIGSIAGNAIEDYAEVARGFATIDAMKAVELNVSCPNVHGGTEFGVDPVALADLIVACREQLDGKPMLVKLSPIAVGQPGIVDMAIAAIEAGAGGLCLANTVPAMAIDVRTRRPKLANVTGGLSGPAVHPIAVRLVHMVYRGVAKDAGVPIVGIGGVMTWRDAAEFILAGASAVEVGTALFVDPRAPKRITKGLAKWARSQGAASITDLVGALAGSIDA